ncbi:MAG: hypothetical protein KBD29_00260 [Candidatus Magasanikbacteria bacterium]|nr:hypothetical protein [Candidatus Magasanikbacteria bacterium]
MKIIEIFIWSITVTLAFVYAVIFQWTINPPTIHTSKVTVVAPTSTNQIVESVEKKEDVWALRWKDDEGEVILATSTNKNYWTEVGWVSKKPNILEYKKGDTNFLIFFDHSGLVLFDTLKKTTTALFKKEVSYDELMQLLLVDDTVFFTFGSYMSGAKPKYIDLSEEEKNVQELVMVQERRPNDVVCESMVIQKWGQYWVYCFFGDTGLYWADYTLFDPSTKIMGEKHTEGQRGYKSDTILGVTKDGLLIKAYAEQREENPEVDSLYFYTKVTLNQLNNAEVSTTLFSLENMPLNTSDILYREEDEDLYFIGEEVWVYNVETKETRKIKPQKSLSGFTVTEFFKDGRVCLNNMTETRAVWDIADNSVEYANIYSCDLKAEDESIKAQPLLPEGLPPQLEVVEL